MQSGENRFSDKTTGQSAIIMKPSFEVLLYINIGGYFHCDLATTGLVSSFRHMFNMES